MRLLPTLLLTLLGTAASAAKPKKTPQERFSLYHTKSLASAPVKLRDPAYRELRGAPRDYSVAVLLTAMDSRYGCQLCREFQPEWDLLARSWTAGDKKGESRIVFGTLDFSDGREVFMSVCAPGLPLFGRVWLVLWDMMADTMGGYS
jgi:oligosaccharyltransferase complex subunit gamma